jgi:hypothetical protein
VKEEEEEEEEEEEFRLHLLVRFLIMLTSKCRKL